MAKYKYISESFLDNFLEKVFKKAFDQNYSSAIKKIRKKDPELAKDLDKIADMRKKHFKRLDKLSKTDREKRLQKAKDIVSSF